METLDDDELEEWKEEVTEDIAFRAKVSRYCSSQPQTLDGEFECAHQMVPKYKKWMSHMDRLSIDEEQDNKEARLKAYDILPRYVWPSHAHPLSKGYTAICRGWLRASRHQRRFQHQHRRYLDGRSTYHECR